MNKFHPALSWFTTLLIPLALLGLGVRLILLPLFIQIEYRMPYFPVDDYGFTIADRLHWAPYAFNYLVNQADISYLGNLKFSDGQPLFNDRELSHMHDVKGVMQGGLRIWYGCLVMLLLLGAWAWRSDCLPFYLQGLKRGGWLMVGVAVATGSIVIIGITMDPDLFWNFFASFHSLFFKGDSWLFAYSDTLIRLFPIRFWQDTFMTVALIVFGCGLGLALGLKTASKNNPS